MRCPYCRWTGPFKSFGRHQWKKHKARVQRNLAKARRAPRKRKEASEPTQKRKSSPDAPRERGGAPECPPGFVVDTITYRRA